MFVLFICIGWVTYFVIKSFEPEMKVKTLAKYKLTRGQKNFKRIYFKLGSFFNKYPNSLRHSVRYYHRSLWNNIYSLSQNNNKKFQRHRTDNLRSEETLKSIIKGSSTSEERLSS